MYSGKLSFADWCSPLSFSFLHTSVNTLLLQKGLATASQAQTSETQLSRDDTLGFTGNQEEDPLLWGPAQGTQKITQRPALCGFPRTVPTREPSRLNQCPLTARTAINPLQTSVQKSSCSSRTNKTRFRNRRHLPLGEGGPYFLLLGRPVQGTDCRGAPADGALPGGAQASQAVLKRVRARLEGAAALQSRARLGRVGGGGAGLLERGRPRGAAPDHHRLQGALEGRAALLGAQLGQGGGPGGRAAAAVGADLLPRLRPLGGLGVLHGSGGEGLLLGLVVPLVVAAALGAPGILGGGLLLLQGPPALGGPGPAVVGGGARGRRPPRPVGGRLVGIPRVAPGPRRR